MRFKPVDPRKCNNSLTLTGQVVEKPKRFGRVVRTELLERRELMIAPGLREITSIRHRVVTTHEAADHLARAKVGQVVRLRGYLTYNKQSQAELRCSMRSQVELR